ncbi:hypothetical protein EIL50_02720 [bacterium NHP-B]|nr:hypothetical protein EIL50_02720 [bacterium NHP-B]
MISSSPLPHLTPHDYEVAHKNPLYDQQFRVDSRQASQDFVAHMVGQLMDSLFEAMVSNPFDDQEAPHSSLAVMKEPMVTAWGQSLVESGQFDDLVDDIQKNVMAGQRLEKAQASLLQMPFTVDVKS